MSKQWSQSYANLVVIKSMSKVFGVAGIRLGYLLSADRAFINAVRASLPIWNINGLAEEFSTRRRPLSTTSSSASCELTLEKPVYSSTGTCLHLPGIDAIEPDANFVLVQNSPSPAAYAT